MAHRMRGDRLGPGLGPIAEIQGGAGRAGIEAGDGDGCRSIRDIYIYIYIYTYLYIYKYICMCMFIYFNIYLDF